MRLSSLSIDAPPYRLTGTVYCALLNYEPVLLALGDAVNEAPYKARPREPVLAVRPRNTLAGDGSEIVVPADMPELVPGPSLGIVISRCASRVSIDDALSFVGGYVVVNDISAPLPSHYRPSVRLKARDGFCPINTSAVAAATITDPDNLKLELAVDGKVVQTGSTGGRIRGVARLLADVTDFMTLQAGDILMLGISDDSIRVRAGQTTTVTIQNVGTLTNSFIAEQESS